MRSNETTGKSDYTLKQYMLDANHAVKTGQYAKELNGYVKVIGGPDNAKAVFVGMTKGEKSLTTFHVKSVKEIAKKAPSLGWGL